MVAMLVGIWGAIIVSCIASALSLYAIFIVRSEEESFDEKMFVEDLNEQIKVMQERISGLVKEDIDEVRSEYKTGFELCIKHHEELAGHVNENFTRCFKNYDELNEGLKKHSDRIDKRLDLCSDGKNSNSLEIQALWSRLLSLKKKKDGTLKRLLLKNKSLKGTQTIRETRNG